MNHVPIIRQSQPPVRPLTKWLKSVCARNMPTKQTAPQVAALIFLLFSVVICAQILSSTPKEDSTISPVYAQASDKAAVNSLPNGFVMSRPNNLVLKTAVFTQDKLYRGKLMLIDAAHPVPALMPVPNTLSIAAHGSGQVATRSAQTLTDKETLYALSELFQAGRQKGIGNWTVFAGTRSNEQQLDLQLEQLKVFAQTHTLEAAAAMAVKTWESPGCSEHQTGYAIDIRLCDDWNAPAREEKLADSREGQYLLDNAWRYGFIYRYTDKNPHRMQEENYHFRFVGKSAAKLMHLASMTFEQFLQFLREHPEWAYYEGDKLKYYVVCQEVTGDWLTKAPEGTVDICVSADNTGYAIAIYEF